MTGYRAGGGDERQTDRREDAFDEFYQSSARTVVHLIYASTGDLTLAQDCTQEAFSRAWQQWSKVSAYDDPLAWVRTVARRAVPSPRGASGPTRAARTSGTVRPPARPARARTPWRR